MMCELLDWFITKWFQLFLKKMYHYVFDTIILNFCVLFIYIYYYSITCKSLSKESKF